MERPAAGGGGPLPGRELTDTGLGRRSCRLGRDRCGICSWCALPGREALQQQLQQAGIGTLIHYPVPPHLQPAYAELGFGTGAFPLTEAIHQEVLSLPMGPGLTLDEQEPVVAAAREGGMRLAVV